MKKKLLAAVCAICTCITSTSFYISAAAVYQGEYITYGDLVSTNPGNIFYGNEPIVFKIDVKNTKNFTVYGRYSYTITDESGQVVYSYGPSSSAGLGAGKKTTRTINLPQNGKYGFYKLNLTEESGTSPTGSMVSAEFTADFSVCIPLDDGDVNESLGFNQAIVNNGNSAAVSLMKHAGAKWHREDVSWVGVEPTVKGSYIRLNTYKDKLSEMRNNGVNTVCILNGRNSLYCDKTWKYSGGNWVEVTKMPTTDEAIEAYARFCAYVARNLKGAVTHYEIYNEWNSTQFNPTYNTDAGVNVYAKVLKAAYNAIKAEDPESTVIGCSTAGIDTGFITGVLDAYDGEGRVYMDAVSLHCYDFDAVNGFPEQTFRSYAEDLKALLAHYDLENMPVWLTEIGFSTYTGPQGAFFVPGCTEDVQLNSMVMLEAVNKVYGAFDNIIQYALNDRGIDNTTIEQNWGVLRAWNDGDLKNGAKPAYLGLAAMNYFIGGNAEFTDKTEDTANRQYAFGFYNHKLNKKVTLLINGGFDNAGERTLDLGCWSIDVYDKYGNLTEHKSSEDGRYEVMSSSEPVYLVYGPELTVKKSGTAVTKMSELNSGDSLEISMRGMDASAASPSVIAAQYNGERFIKADPFPVNGTEFSENITVADGADRIKVVYWNMDKLTPLCRFYDID